MLHHWLKRMGSQGRSGVKEEGASLQPPTTARRRSPAASTATIATTALGPAISHRDATWRAGFALRVYEVMVRQPKDYAVVRQQVASSKSCTPQRCGNSHSRAMFVCARWLLSFSFCLRE